MSSGQIPYYDGYDSDDFPKKIPFNKTTYGRQKEYIKNKSLENPSSKKMSFGQILYYDGYGSYDFPEKFRSIKPELSGYPNLKHRIR